MVAGTSAYSTWRMIAPTLVSGFRKGAGAWLKFICNFRETSDVRRRAVEDLSSHVSRSFLFSFLRPLQRSGDLRLLRVAGLHLLQRFQFPAALFFLLARFALEPRLARLVAAAGVVCLGALLVLAPDFGLRVAEVTHQGNLAGADEIAAAALDAVEQVVFLHALEVARAGVPVEHLRQQRGGTGVRAGAAANAGECLASRRELLGRAG